MIVYVYGDAFYKYMVCVLYVVVMHCINIWCVLYICCGDALYKYMVCIIYVVVMHCINIWCVLYMCMTCVW